MYLGIVLLNLTLLNSRYPMYLSITPGMQLRIGSLKNHTLSGGTYLSSPFMDVPPTPGTTVGIITSLMEMIFFRENLRADLSILSALSLHCVTKTAQAGGFFKNGRFMLDTFEPSVDVVFTQL